MRCLIAFLVPRHGYELYIRAQSAALLQLKFLFFFSISQGRRLIRSLLSSFTSTILVKKKRSNLTMSFPAPTTYHHNPTPITDPTQEHLSASGKAVLVTGGGTTIGKSIVESFAKAKAKTVFLTGRRLHLLEDVAKKVLNR